MASRNGSDKQKNVLRQMLQQNADLARKLAQLGKKYCTQFRAVFDAIRTLMKPPEMKALVAGVPEPEGAT